MSVIGTTRRLQALCRVNWSQDQMAAAFGIPKDAIRRSIHGKNDLDSEVIAEMYPSMLQGPGVTPVAYYISSAARKCGYAAPEDWENVDIDDPNAVPGGEVEVEPCVPILRGAVLAIHVREGLRHNRSPLKISMSAGYPQPQRCAKRLADSGNANLGRTLLVLFHAEVRRARAQKAQARALAG